MSLQSDKQVVHMVHCTGSARWRKPKPPGNDTVLPWMGTSLDPHIILITAYIPACLKCIDSRIKCQRPSCIGFDICNRNNMSDSCYDEYQGEMSASDAILACCRLPSYALFWCQSSWNYMCMCDPKGFTPCFADCAVR